MADYTPIIQKIRYWRDYEGEGEDYRRHHDLDCVLTDGNLSADTIFSLWLPLRYALNYFDSPRWIYWKDMERAVLRPQKFGLKNHKPFLAELERDIECFLPEHEITDKLARLFLLGQMRSNVMILPYRCWNSERGCKPYYDYLPHFLWDKLSGSDDIGEIVEWIKRERLEMLFKDGLISRDMLLDLAGTGDVRCHETRNIVLPVLLTNYIRILKLRESALNLEAKCGTDY